MTELIHVLLVDDHAVVRAGLRAVLEKDRSFSVIGEAEDGAHAIEQAVALRPDVIVMDITLPDFDGIETTRRIRAKIPEARVLALTMHDEETYLVPFLRAGGMGYVRKSSSDRDLMEAIRRVARGESYLQPGGVDAIVREHRMQEPAPDTLSERERQVLILTAKGYTSREIGDQLALSPRTVETYRERIMQKLGLGHRSELVEYALRHNLLG